MNNGYQPKRGTLGKLPTKGSNVIKSNDKKYANIVWKKRITGSNNIVKTCKVMISKIP